MLKITILVAIFITMIECKYLLVDTNNDKGEDMNDDHDNNLIQKIIEKGVREGWTWQSRIDGFVEP